MKKTKLSIIIPVYNAEKYLDECLTSVTNQTLDNYEIVCVNDGSTDKTLEILKKFQEHNDNIKIIDQPNQGVIGARIAGYKNATGEYIGWVDSDDFVDKTMFEKLYQAALKNEADVVICNYNFYPNEVINKKKWFNEFQGQADWKFVNKNTVQWNKIVKKELLDSLNIIDLFENVGEGCYSFVLIKAKNIVTINECLYNYRVGQQSLSSNFSNIKWYVKTVDRAKQRKAYAAKYQLSSEWIEFFQYLVLYYTLILLIVAAYNGDKSEYNKCKKVLKKEELFTNKYKKYLINDFSKLKIKFFKYVGIRNYNLMSLAAKFVLKK